MVKWESLKLFIAAHLGLEREDFVELYSKPVLIQQKKQGVPIKLLLKVDQAAKGVIKLDELEKKHLPGFGDPKMTSDVFTFLPNPDEGKSVLVGRDPSAEIHLDFPWIDPKHAKFGKNHMGLYTLTDLGSKEKTYLNETEMLRNVEYPVVDFTQIMFGRVIKYFFLAPEGLYEYLKIISE